MIRERWDSRLSIVLVSCTSSPIASLGMLKGYTATNVIYDRYMKACGWHGLLTWWLYYLPLVVQRQHVLFTRGAEQITANAIDTQSIPLRQSPGANRAGEASEPTAHDGHQK
jgi:hypothetical protein